MRAIRGTVVCERYAGARNRSFIQPGLAHEFTDNSHRPLHMYNTAEFKDVFIEKSL